MDLDLLINDSLEETLDKTLSEFGYQMEGRNQLCARYAGTDDDLPINVLFVDKDTFAKLAAESVSVSVFGVTVRASRLMGVIALKLHAMKNDPRRELRDLNDIIQLLNANPGEVEPLELEETCRRFGPSEIYSKLANES